VLPVCVEVEGGKAFRSMCAGAAAIGLDMRVCHRSMPGASGAAGRLVAIGLSYPSSCVLGEGLKAGRFVPVVQLRLTLLLPYSELQVVPHDVSAEDWTTDASACPIPPPPTFLAALLQAAGFHQPQDMCAVCQAAGAPRPTLPFLLPWLLLSTSLRPFSSRLACIRAGGVHLQGCTRRYTGRQLAMETSQLTQPPGAAQAAAGNREDHYQESDHQADTTSRSATSTAVGGTGNRW
jgi:hypothetical protein